MAPFLFGGGKTYFNAHLHMPSVLQQYILKLNTLYKRIMKFLVQPVQDYKKHK